MKVTIKRVALLEGLGKVRHGIPTKSLLPAACRVLLKAEKGLALVGWNFDTVVIVPVKAKVDKPGQHAVFPAKLEGFLKACDAENIVISLKTISEKYQDWEAEKDANGVVQVDAQGITKRVQVTKTRKTERLVIEAGTASTTLDTVPGKDFPAYKELEERPACTIYDLAKSLEQVDYAMASDQTRPTLYGVSFRCKAGKLELCAADGFRLAMTRPTVKGRLLDFVMPFEAVNLTRKLFAGKVSVASHTEESKAGQYEVKQCDTWLSFKADSITVLVHAVPGNFPPYDQLIPAGGKVFQCRGDDMRKAIKLVASIKPVADRFLLEKKGTSVIAYGEDDDGQRTEMRFPARGKVKICLDYKYLNDIMARTNGTFNMRFSDGAKPIVVKEGKTTHVLMPMTVK